jgi:hypothetical protein
MNYKLIASDCDGTLINSDSQLTERTKTAIEKCMDKGVIFVMATGRPTYGVQWFIDMFEQDMPIITYNGSFACMSKSQKVIVEDKIPAELCREAIKLGMKHKLGVVTYVDNKLYIAERNEWTDSYANYFKLNPEVSGDIFEIVKNGAAKVVWIDDPKKINSYYHETQAHFDGRLNCFTSASFLFELVAADASKGTAIQKIGEIYGIKPEEMIAVGDGFNDVDMLEFAGLGVAVDNAPQGVKDAANEITLSNDEDGVAAVIEKYVL